MSIVVKQLKIFVLEDSPDRIRSFGKWFGPGLGMDDPVWWTCINTCQDDFEFCPPYDVIFLDHDLGRPDLPDGTNDGSFFVSSVRAYIPTDTPIIIHSFNAAGAERMMSLLRGVTSEVAYLPFGSPAFLENIREIQRMVGLEVNA